tara:strand:+ start:106 stop:270 length:165 start_codon:yes stop_codon:yes gene_type:complete
MLVVFQVFQQSLQQEEVAVEVQLLQLFLMLVRMVPTVDLEVVVVGVHQAVEHYH